MNTLDHVGRGSYLGESTLRRSRRRVLLVPALAAAILFAAGWWTVRTVERTMRAETRETLSVVLQANLAALRTWVGHHVEVAGLLAKDPRVVADIEELLAVERTPQALSAAAAQARLRELAAPIVDRFDFFGFGVFTPEGLLVAAARDSALGRSVGAVGADVTTRVFGDESIVLPPQMFERVEDDGTVSAGAALLIATPVLAEDGRVVAGFGFLADAAELGRILETARAGESAEAYAFDGQGRLVTASRFDEQLRSIGLIPEDSTTGSALLVEVRDPGGDLTRGFRPALARKAQPMTHMAADAVEGRAGTDVDGYRDYRGVEVVGAWSWLPDYGFGVAVEIDTAEAFAALGLLRGVFWTLLGLLAAGTGVLSIGSRVVVRLQSRVSAAQQLGQYTLEEKLGEGAMGQVYRARHALLRRPTAVKVLTPEKITEERLKRFEQEVQLTAQLTHPNTIAIYDFGRSEQGVFYYAMEYLDGVTLEKLVRQRGCLPPPLAVHVLGQICGSLAEAHGVGLIHRDIKPANLMICRRGGLRDFVKVLDFGLVKDIAAGPDAGVTMEGYLVGTPHYLAPEMVRSHADLDGRADLYALGAVGYWMITGTTVFTGKTIPEVVTGHLNEEPERPSERLGRAVPGELESILMRCLEKDRDARFASAESLGRALDALPEADAWDPDAAAAWWDTDGSAESV